MGLYVHSLENIPTAARRSYFVYLLDYGWPEPLADALRSHFDSMSQKAAQNDAVVIKGTEIGHFNNEVFSWHQINGEDGDSILPAILVTNKHPQYFREDMAEYRTKNEVYKEKEDKELKLIIIPLKNFCRDALDVSNIIQNLFKDIVSQKDLSDFSICKEIQADKRSSFYDAVILQPNFSGIGFDIKKFFQRG